MERCNNVFATLHPNVKQAAKKIEVENMDNTFAISLKFPKKSLGYVIILIERS